MSEAMSELAFQSTDWLQVLRSARIGMGDAGVARQCRCDAVGGATRDVEAGALRKLEPSDCIPGTSVIRPIGDTRVAGVTVATESKERRALTSPELGHSAMELRGEQRAMVRLDVATHRQVARANECQRPVCDDKPALSSKPLGELSF
jgi:hypothetical protein